jgi:eukaryotic-like serine/threonine-protein kinase
MTWGNSLQQHQTVNQPDDDDASVWPFQPGEPVVPGYDAWVCFGRGDRCETWLTWSCDRFAPAVVKLVVPADVADPPSIAALAREARILDGMTHPFLPRLYHDGTRDERPHLVLEYVEGPSLEAMIHDVGAFSPTDAATIGIQILMALHYLHSSGFAHLDVKPANIVFRDGRPVLVDLGLARALGSLAPAGPPWGTDDYMAPEQAAKEPTSIASDLYGLGATLTALVTTRTPPRPGTPLVWRPSSQVGARLKTAIEHLRAPNPADRPSSAKAAMLLLRTVRPSLAPPWPPFADPQ